LKGISKFVFIYLFQYLGQDIISFDSTQQHPIFNHLWHMVTSVEFLRFPSPSRMREELDELWSAFRGDVCVRSSQQDLKKQIISSIHSNILQGISFLNFNVPPNSNNSFTFGDLLNAVQNPIDISLRRENQKLSEHYNVDPPPYYESNLIKKN
jgi:hypothetical protein